MTELCSVKKYFLHYKIAKKMEANDLLNLKTTNINVRLSPMLKSKLIEHGAKLGINLSDFIGYVLTKPQCKPKKQKRLCYSHNRLKINGLYWCSRQGLNL